jgi:hypothetical protein
MSKLSARHRAKLPSKESGLPEKARTSSEADKVLKAGSDR